MKTKQGNILKFLAKSLAHSGFSMDISVLPLFSSTNYW